MGGVCNSSQTKRPVEEINISNKQCQINRQIAKKNLQTKCEYCQLDLSKELKQKHICNPRIELEAIVQEELSQPEFFLQQQNIINHPTKLNEDVGYIANDKAELSVEQKQESEQDSASQMSQYDEFPKKLQFYLRKFEHTSLQEQFQENSIPIESDCFPIDSQFQRPFYQQLSQLDSSEEQLEQSQQSQYSQFFYNYILEQQQQQQQQPTQQFQNQFDLDDYHSNRFGIQYASIQTEKEDLLRIKTRQKIVNSLNVITYVQNTNLSDENKKCTICITEYEEGDELNLLPCTHRYHSECISNWLQTNQSCPICKNYINQE